METTSTTNYYRILNYAARFHLGFDLIVISLLGWVVRYARIKIKAMLSCDKVQLYIQITKESPSCSYKRAALIYRGPNLVVVVVVVVISLKI